MEEREVAGRRHPPVPLGIGLVLALVALVLAILVRWWRRRPVEREETLPLQLPPGLTEEEAAARYLEGQDNVIRLNPPRSRERIWKDNAITVFNLNLVGVGFTQVLLGQWLNAGLTLAFLVLNIWINVSQETRALKRLIALEESTRPRATVVREGNPRSIDPSRLVQGDVLLVGPGDQMLVDGEVVGPGRLVVNEWALTGKRAWHTKVHGEAIYAGSLCISGRGAVIARRVGDERAIISRIGVEPDASEELTPLERMVDRILRVLLVLVMGSAALLLIAYFRLDTGIPADLMSEVIGILFSLAPAGLFLMITVNYTTGQAYLAQLGALVRRAWSVESLAEASVICFAEAGILTGTHMEIEDAEASDADQSVDHARLRHILGDFARSTSARNLVFRIIMDTFDGNRRAVREEAPFMSAYGWSAVAFENADLHGVFVLGEPEVLEPHLVPQEDEPEEPVETEPSTGAVRRLVSPLGRLFTRRDVGAPDDGDTDDEAPPVLPESSQQLGQDEGQDEGQEAFPRRWMKRLRNVVRRGQGEGQTHLPDEELEQGETAESHEAILQFAYSPQVVPLHGADGLVRLPDELIPLCRLRYSRRLRPEAIETIQGFFDSGVAFKVFSSGDPDQVLATLRQAKQDGDVTGELLELGTVSGSDMDNLPAESWTQAARENTIFGNVTPEQTGGIVRALRKGGESVAVVGDGVSDLPALQQGNLAICRHSSTQAALSVADIVLLGTSPKVLLDVLDRGQRIVHRLLDVLKLSLTQVLYLALLIVVIRALDAGFPYTGAQGSAVSIITVTLPSLGLAFWAPGGVVAGKRFGRALIRFVVPAAVTVSLAALLVYFYFLERTGSIPYAQLTLTYTLIYTGLLLAILVDPPWRSRRGEGDGFRTMEWRMVALALVLGIVAPLLPAIPLAQQLFKLDWLQQPADYGVIALVVVAWAVILNLVWRVLPSADLYGDAGSDGES